MKKEYAVVRTDNLSGTTVPADLVSVKYYDGADPSEMENGCVVKLAGLLEGEREIYKATDPAEDTAIDSLALVASPEVLYDERDKNLSNFVNKKSIAARGYLLRAGNVFSVTKLAFTADSKDPEVGDAVVLSGTNKLKVISGDPATATKVGAIIEIEKTTRYTYYVIRVGI